jgi:hypothetical protein
MCFGDMLRCTRCDRITTYLRPGVRRCPTRGTTAHIIIGPEIVRNFCWFCEAVLAGGYDGVVAEMDVMHEKAAYMMGFERNIVQTSEFVQSLASEIEEESDEAKKNMLEELKTEEEAKLADYKAALVANVKYTCQMEQGPAPMVVYSVPHKDYVPHLTFQEWTGRFGSESPEGRREECKPWERLNSDCEGYETYLEENGLEYEADEFRMNDEFFQDVARKSFHEGEMLSPENKDKLLSFSLWQKKERFGILLDSEKERKSKHATERFERDLYLYVQHHLNDPMKWSEEVFFYEAQTRITKVRRDALYRAQAQLGPLLPPHVLAEEDEVLLTFKEWRSSRSTQDVESEKYTILCDQLRRYTHYLYRFPPTVPRAMQHFRERNRLEVARADGFKFQPRPNLEPDRRFLPPPMSFSAFSSELETYGYKTEGFDWLSEAYMLYLGACAESGILGSFRYTRDCWARDDRHELEGLPRSNPIIADLESVLRRLAQHVHSIEDMRRRIVVWEFLSGAILMLDSYMNQRRRPTHAEWNAISAAYHFANMMGDIAVRTPIGPDGRFITARRPDPAELLIDVPARRHRRRSRSRRAALPPPRLAARQPYSVGHAGLAAPQIPARPAPRGPDHLDDEDSEAETNIEDDNHPIQGPFIHPPYIPERDSDDEGTSDEDSEGDGGAQLGDVWLALHEDAEYTDDEDDIRRPEMMDMGQPI